MMNPFALFDFVAGQRASHEATQKDGKDFELMCPHAIE
jgi:hypothetical protein